MAQNFVPSVVEQLEEGVCDEIGLDEGELRAKIAAIDEQIELYEASIGIDDTEVLDKMDIEAELAIAQFKDLQDEIANIQNQQPELERIMATSEEKTEETAEKLDTVQNAIHGANEAHNKCVKDDIDAREKMMEENGYDPVRSEHVKEQVVWVRARIAELEAKAARIVDLKQQLKVKLVRNATLKLKQWQMESDQVKKEQNQAEKSPDQESKRQKTHR